MRLLLFSGGVESTCLAAMYRPDLLLTLDYGQVPADGEKRAARFIADRLSLSHDTLTVPMRLLGVGDMAGTAPFGSGEATEAWPFRNQMLITLAAMRFSRDGYTEFMIGTVRSDCIHPDGTLEFVHAIDQALQIQDTRIRLTAPAIDMSTFELVQASNVSRDLLGWTFSCHRAAVACGQCRGCQKTVELLRALDEPVDDHLEQSSAQHR